LGALPKIHLFDKPVDKQAVKEFLEGRIKELAAIMFTDIAGYTAQMSKDE